MFYTFRSYRHFFFKYFTFDFYKFDEIFFEFDIRMKVS